MYKTNPHMSTRQTTPTPKTTPQPELLKEKLRDNLELFQKGNTFGRRAVYEAADSITILGDLSYYAKNHPAFAPTLKSAIAELNPLIKTAVHGLLEDGEYLFARELALKAGLSADDTKEFKEFLISRIKANMAKQERRKKTDAAAIADICKTICIFHITKSDADLSSRKEEADQLQEYNGRLVNKDLDPLLSLIYDNMIREAQIFAKETTLPPTVFGEIKKKATIHFLLGRLVFASDPRMEKILDELGLLSPDNKDIGKSLVHAIFTSGWDAAQILQFKKTFHISAQEMAKEEMKL